MASHRKTNAPTLLSLSKRQWIRIVAIAAAIVMVVAAGIVSRNFYIGRGRGTAVNEYSPPTSPEAASREATTVRICVAPTPTPAM